MHVRKYRVKTRLSTENGARIGVNAFTERKRNNRVKSVARKGEYAFTKRQRRSKKANTLLPSETVTRKGENVHTEPKRLTLRS